MTHYLYRPHVVGPENNITTPDLIVDRVACHEDDRIEYIPVQRLTTNGAGQCVATELSIKPATAFIASGGGVLFGIAVLVQVANAPLATADIMLGRTTWRLRNIMQHYAALQIDLTIGSASYSAKLEQLAPPEQLLEVATDGVFELPRGVIALNVATDLEGSALAPDDVSIRAGDAQRDRKLEHTIQLLPAAADHWQQRPAPRYTVGPVADVPHYI